MPNDGESHPNNSESHPNNSESHPNNSESHPNNSESHPYDGKSYLSWLDKLCSAIIAIGTLGAGFTFSVIVGGPGNLPANADLHPEGVRFCLALSWLLFVLSLGLASAVAVGTGLNGPLARWVKKGFDSETYSVRFTAITTTLVLELLALAAFMASARAVAAYVRGVGWAAMVLTACFSIGFILVWAAQLFHPVNQFFLKVWKII